LIVDIELTRATGYAERDTALEMLRRLPAKKRRRTVAGDKAYDTRGFVADLRELHITPHLAPNATRQRSTIDRRTTRHESHAVSQRIRKPARNPSAWIKTIAGGRKLRYIGRGRNRAWFRMYGAVYNILRITALTGIATLRATRNPTTTRTPPHERERHLESRFSAHLARGRVRLRPGATHRRGSSGPSAPGVDSKARAPRPRSSPGRSTRGRASSRVSERGRGPRSSSDPTSPGAPPCPPRTTTAGARPARPSDADERAASPAAWSGATG